MRRIVGAQFGFCSRTQGRSVCRAVAWSGVREIERFETQMAEDPVATGIWVGVEVFSHFKVKLFARKKSVQAFDLLCVVTALNDL